MRYFSNSGLSNSLRGWQSVSIGGLQGRCVVQVLVLNFVLYNDEARRPPLPFSQGTLQSLILYTSLHIIDHALLCCTLAVTIPCLTLPSICAESFWDRVSSPTMRFKNVASTTALVRLGAMHFPSM
jgi:hypothetical protein